MTSLHAYRPAAFRPVPPWRRWWPLAWQEATNLFRTKWGVAMFCVCLLPVLIRLAMLLIAFGVIQFGPNELRQRLTGSRPRGQLAMLDPRAVEFYVEPVLQVMPGMVFTLLLTTLVVARAIARDRATNALELYWTRGISPTAYLFAKWVGSAMLIGAITVLAPFALWVTAVFLAEDWSLFADSWPGMLAALAGLTVATAVWTGLGILVSASCAKPNTAMVLWALLLVGSSAVAVVISAALRDPSYRSTLSVWHAGGVVAREIAGLPQPRGPGGEPRGSVSGALWVLGTLLVVLFLRARPRLRLQEAVG